ncbi:N-acetyl-gamma-glutamyl-phosphate reductase [Sphingomonas panacisoli]|uniref:N-acetyl-gamma-glutamyl-phosphate reductase n=1 Tax=Sphingomonas panacisoli TaxID=1813879 RepID=A0A5B8LIF8_9SPHN|nr:N-acetyl-gamma-glutamyl-phosphate reductase [Sphingomonas panacisoli]QDZ07609.1 N-acetyl-gamma-glutamyl-phosphate reductase [Sphingomonas panacisoli]
MTIGVFIDGGHGTTGLEIADRLDGRDDIALIVLDDAHRKDDAARRAALNDADFVILCLPDDASRDAVGMISSAKTRVIDASSAHRVADGWTYGFAELEADQQAVIAAAPRVTNPGCYPTGFLALVRPLVRAGLIPTSWPLSVNALSGYSGGGKAMIAEFEGGESPTRARAYGLDLAHKHIAEMRRHAGIDHLPIFQPGVADTYRGMIVEVPLPLHALPGKPTLAQVEAVLTDAYKGSPLVRIASGDVKFVRIEDDAGTDRLTLRVCGNDATGQARLIATLDNLGKGAAGAAVQNLNIMAGFDATVGLTL